MPDIDTVGSGCEYRVEDTVVEFLWEAMEFFGKVVHGA